MGHVISNGNELKWNMKPFSISPAGIETQELMIGSQPRYYLGKYSHCSETHMYAVIILTLDSTYKHLQ